MVPLLFPIPGLSRSTEAILPVFVMGQDERKQVQKHRDPTCSYTCNQWQHPPVAAILGHPEKK